MKKYNVISCPKCEYDGFYVEEGETLDFIPEHYCSCNEYCTDDEHACFVESVRLKWKVQNEKNDIH